MPPLHVASLGQVPDCPSATFAAGSSLKVVSTFSAGYDHVDTEQLAKRGITLGTSKHVQLLAIACSTTY